uniref:Uncharacterized protein n=1 Tax=Romanomermis culicivorax TaxID=13658 RepID=A0A915J4M8_ROMCU
MDKNRMPWRILGTLLRNHSELIDEILPQYHYTYTSRFPNSICVIKWEKGLKMQNFLGAWRRVNEYDINCFYLPRTRTNSIRICVN